jgi:riboflavin transporter FmnP
MEPKIDAFERNETSIVSPSLSGGILKLRTLIIVSLFSSLSLLLMYTIEFPLIPAFPVLKYDPGDIPALIAGFSINTSAGIYVLLLKNFLYLLSGKGLTTLAIGPLMNLAAGSIMVFVSTKIYFLKPCKKYAIAGLVAGTISMALFMLPANYLLLRVLPFILPQLGKVLSMDRALIFLFTGTLPFNILKGAITSVFTFFLYKKISNFIKK